MEKEIYENSNKRKSVVQIILPTTSIKSEKSANQTDENNLNEWIEDKKKKINLLISRIYRRRSRRGSNISAVRKQTMREKIQPRYLTMEPLCCLSSCLVRTGCHFVAILEIFYVLLVLITISFRLYDNGCLKFWTELDKTELNYNKIVKHQATLYIFALFAILTLIMALLLVYGLLTFERIYIKIHWRFDIASLIFNIIFFIIYTIALAIEWPVTSLEITDLLLVVAFATQIPIQIWAISVVKKCYDFYLLLHVFVTLAEK